MLLTNFYNQFPKATIKIIFQMLTILTFADIVWISLFSGAWEHGQENKNPSGEIQFWESLWFIHKIVYILAYVELILKGLLLYYLFADFKEKYKQVIENIKAFQGHAIIHTMFMKGETEEGEDVDNTTEDFVKPWLEAVKYIAPSEVMVYTIDRETPDNKLQKASHEELDGIKERVIAMGIPCTASY